MRPFTFSAVVIGLLGMGVPALAQTTPQSPRSDRPYQGLFGGDTTNAKQMLSISASFGGGYDQDIFADQSLSGGINKPPGVGSAGSTGFIVGSASLSYGIAMKKGSFSASYGTGTGYYPGLDEPTVLHHNGAIGGQYRVARHSVISASQTETYQPFFFFSFLPTNVGQVEPVPVFDPSTMTLANAAQAASLALQQPVVADTTLASNADYYLTSESGVSFSQQLTQRLSLSAGYSYRRTDSRTNTRDYWSSGGDGRLSYAIGKGLSVVAGYGYFVTEYLSSTGNTEFRGHNVDVGVNYAKALSFSRRTTLSFSTGTTGTSDGIQTHWGITGNAQLTREIGRTWAAGLGYNRSIGFVETFAAPVQSDSVSGGISGLFNRRTQAGASFGLSRGAIGYSDLNNFNNFDSSFVSAGLRYALSRRMGISVNYTLYRYTFDRGIVLPGGVSNHTNRQAIRASFDLWEPLIQRNRSANATR